jgi:uroporphyrinogen III methyltransferase / synthase
MKPGKVYLVGAGPGDLGLFTQRGIETLARADVVVYDYLADEKLLNWAKPGAEIIYAGKTGKQHTREQFEINQILVENAQRGKTVVRLKGGDPFVFGRGGEEAEALVKRDIPFEVIPGISSAVAVPAYAGIPVTHRDRASSFAVITGHEDPAKGGSRIRWEKLATGVDTLIFLMGMQNLSQITGKLIEYGRPVDTPVAVIKDGTRPEQRTVTGTLGNIVTRVEEQKLGPPAVIVVGEVVKLREKLRWFDNRPLSGKRVLVTRARHQASELSRLLTEQGAVPVELAAIDIQRSTDTRELDAAITNLSQYQWIIFTSVNGVEAFFERIRYHSLDTRTFKGIMIGAIGPATSRALEARGLNADYCPTVYTSQGLLEGLKGLNVKGQQFLLPRADIADKELTGGLVNLGAKVHEVVAYKTASAVADIERARKLLEAGEIDLVTFTSSSTVLNLVKSFGNGKANLNGARVACIGPKTVEAAQKAGLKVDVIASEQTISGLVDAVTEYFQRSEHE